MSAVLITVSVRYQISVGLCSTQPACGRICSCSSWWIPFTLPEWSKIMNRVLVVPWSTAPTKSGMDSPPVADQMNALASSPASTPPMMGPTTGTHE